MKEFRNIITEYNKIDFSRRKAALATVVKVRGSSYRGPGARMLITDDGRWVGSISGGCLEGDALRKARQVMSDKKSITVTYDTREESNQNLGISLGCNGIIDVLIEPVIPDDSSNLIEMLQQFVEISEPIALATIFQVNAVPHIQHNLTGQKLLLHSEKLISKATLEHKLTSQIQYDLNALFNSGHSRTVLYNTNDIEIEVFLELIQPAISLIIFGGGFDARPLSMLAKSLGWNVTITDECVAHIAPVFFPTADKLSLCNRSFIDRDFNITFYTACVLMSHNYEYDRDILKKLLRTDTPYIGIMGPRKRFNKMIMEFADQGIELTKEDQHRIHSPIGLDIGAEAPDEIAIAVIAEIHAKFATRSGGFLKYKKGPIHHRIGTSDQVFKQVYLKDVSEEQHYHHA